MVKDFLSLLLMCLGYIIQNPIKGSLDAMEWQKLALTFQFFLDLK